MKKQFQLFLAVILFLSIPAFSFAAFYGDGVPIDPSFPADTIEGSGFASNSFIATGGSIISFSYNFITSELVDDSGTWNTDVNDWFGVVLMNSNDGTILHTQQINDIDGATWNPIDGWNPVFGPEGDIFLAQTGIQTVNFTIPDLFNGQSVIFGIGVFDLVDRVVPSALLIDDISLPGGDFSDDPFSASGYFGTSTRSGPAGLFEWIPEDSLEYLGITEPGTGPFAYISTFGDSLAPVPVPGAIMLLGSGLLGLVGFRRKINQ